MELENILVYLKLKKKQEKHIKKLLNNYTENSTMSTNHKPLGKLLIQIDLDAGQYQVMISEQGTLKLMNPQEIQWVISPFHVGCMISELRRRQAEADTPSIIAPSPFDISQIHKTKQ